MNEQPINEQTKLEGTPTTEVESSGDSTNAVSLGKFKSAQALLNAYNSLESEFTKRCQRIKELERLAEQTSTENKSCNEVENSGDKTGDAQTLQFSIKNEDKEKILQDYLKEVLGAKSKAIVLDGAGLGLTTPQKKPKTVAEAGELFIKSLDK